MELEMGLPFQVLVVALYGLLALIDVPSSLA